MGFWNAAERRSSMNNSKIREIVELFAKEDKKLVGFFIHADNRNFFIIWKRIYVKDIFHACYKPSIFF